MDLNLYVLSTRGAANPVIADLEFPGLRIFRRLVEGSFLEEVHSLAAVENQPFLICRNYVACGRGLATQARRLIGELDERFPNWALCGNRGARWDGRHVYDFTQNANVAGLQTALGPHPVLSLDDNLLLINPARLRQHRHLAPRIVSDALGVLLSLECLQNGSLMAASPRLMTVRAIAPDDEHEDAIDTHPEFQKYYRSSFLNHVFYVPDGEVNLSEAIDYRYVSEPWSKPLQRDILALYDDALKLSRAGRRPSLTICCRTQFNRLELLERCVFSLAACAEYTEGLADVEVRLITDQPPAVAQPVVTRLSEMCPAAALECWFEQVRPPRFSRTDLLIAAIERARTDYIWFIDDDDFALPPAMTALARCLLPDTAMVVTASSVVLRESWKSPGHGGERPAVPYGERSRRYSAGDVFRVLKGLNFIPICSMLLPVPLMRERLKSCEALGDYNEDYFLLLLALTAPRVEVCVLPTDVASISLRDKENTVLQEDRRHWHFSYASFLLEVLNNEDGNSPFLWQQANAPPY